MPDSDYMTPRQVAETYGFAPPTVWKDVNRGWLPAEKLSERRYIIHKAIAEEYAARRKAYTAAFNHMKDPYGVKESNNA